MGLWSCTSDEALSGGEAYGEPIPVTITLSRGDAQTRTELSENAEGGLDDKWLRNDQLVVINSNNEEVGVLKFVKYVDDLKPNEAVFQGTLEGVADGVYDYTLWYLGGNGTQQTSLSVFANDYETDGGYPMLVKTTLTQQTGKFDDLVRGDLLSKQIKIRVSDHKAAVEQSLDDASRTMTAHLAMASIKLDGVDGVTDGTLKISHAPSNIDPWYDVYFNRVTSNTRAKISAVDHPLVINGVNTSSHVYIVLNPAQYSGDTALVLTLTSGDKTWTATLPDITMEAGKYYRNGADGNQFSVTMTPNSPSTLTLRYHSNFGSDEIYEDKVSIEDGVTAFRIKNYSETNLKKRNEQDNSVCIGWSSTADGKVDISSVKMDEGEYVKDIYAVWSLQLNNPMDKWARYNLVYDKTTGTSSFATSEYEGGSLYQWGRNYGYVDYIDARGDVNANGGYEYAAAGLQYYDAGLGLCVGAPYYYLYAGQIYVNTTNVKNLTKRFLINTSGTDYWIWNNGGSTWGERAIKCGYSTQTPCPTGWRIPNFSDFLEIFPTKETGINSVSSDYVEKKQLTNGTTNYVIRWKLESKGLKIQAIVVPDDFDENTYKSSLDWESAVIVNTYTRIFGHTSVILGHYETNPLPVVGNSYTVAPMPVGPQSGKTYYYTKQNNKYYYYKYNTIVDYGKDMIGNYWMADQKGVMGYLDSSSHPSSGYKTNFDLQYTPTHDASAIRCVKAE